MAIYESFVRCMGACHLCGMILENTYGHLVTKHAAIDKLYMLTILTIPMSWIACRDECIVSYAIKKYQNMDYVLGSAPENAQDIAELFPSKLAYDAFFTQLATLCASGPFWWSTAEPPKSPVQFWFQHSYCIPLMWAIYIAKLAIGSACILVCTSR